MYQMGGNKYVERQSGYHYYNERSGVNTYKKWCRENKKLISSMTTFMTYSYTHRARSNVLYNNK